ncbi:MAG: ATP-binding protein [Pseudomonadota bacterium]
MADTNAPGRPEGGPRVILGERTGVDSGAPRRASDLLDWDKQFGRRSPLSRKIITFNLVSLGLLVAGVLYLSQAQDGLIEMRELAMESEARIMAAAVAENLEDTGLDGVGRERAVQTLRPLAATSRTQVRLFDLNGEFVASSVGQASTPVTADQTEFEPTSQSALISILNELWERATRLYQSRSNVGGEASPQSVAPVAIESILTGQTFQRRTSNVEGLRTLTVAVPLVVDGFGVQGALVLSSRAGEVDAVVRNERSQILQFFALAIILSIFLSLVLANTIVGPLRDLADAAQKGGMRDSSRVNPERIHIPDMSARPDEIGFLSGAMRMMTTALYDRIEANEMFAADVAHEIKNPLTSLRSAVDTFPYAKDDKARGQLLSVIRADVDRLDRLVTDISNASRLDRELVRDEMLVFDLNKLLSSLVEYNAQSAEDIGAKLVDETSGVLKLQGLEGRLAQVFVNLITNAISFSTAGDVVTVKTEVRGDRVLITVTDTGPGIPDDNLADVFGRFYSNRPDKQFGNHSGLGLAISKQIVEAHGGAIWAENVRAPGQGLDTPPQGARFTVELPL